MARKVSSPRGSDIAVASSRLQRSTTANIGVDVVVAEAASGNVVVALLSYRLPYPQFWCFFFL